MSTRARRPDHRPLATATKAAAIGAFLRFFDVAAIGAQTTWAPMLAAVGAITIIVGNVGALGQSSLKRMLGYSGVAQAGYLLSALWWEASSVFRPPCSTCWPTWP